MPKKQRKMFGPIDEFNKPIKSEVGREIKIDRGAAKRASKKPTESVPKTTKTPKVPKLKMAKIKKTKSSIGY